MSAALEALCRRHGVATGYRDMTGSIRSVPETTVHAVLRALGVAPDAAAPSGPVRLPADDEDYGALDLDLPARAPARCFVPGFLRKGRAWGVALQLYQVRSDESLGIGDFRDLRAVILAAGRAGADFVGVNPLHAPFLADPERCSPFSPSNRRFLNPLYIAVEEAPGHATADVPPATRARLRAAPLIDYSAVAEAKRAALRAAWHRWRKAGRAPGSYRGEFDAFVADRGEALRRHAAFEALSSHFAAQGRGAGWHRWPAGYHECDGRAVGEFAAAHSAEIEFHSYLQWVADRQLKAAAQAARAARLRIGLYVDLAVAEAPDGSASWSDRDLLLPGLHIGAPPDLFNARGQDWGLAPLSPVALQERNYAPFRALLDDVLRHAGALRLDHVMGLLRLFCIPVGRPAHEGTYLRYRIDQAFEAVARASIERSAVVIGEDLGTVPEGLRGLLGDAAIHSCRILYFERANGSLKPPGRYPVGALAALSTHDLPTLEGWWSGRDIDLRVGLGQAGEEAAERERAIRKCDVEALMSALVAAGRLPPPTRRDTAPRLDDERAAAVHRHLAGAPSRLFCVRLEDLGGESDPVNVPGTTGEYPNWRRRLASPVDRLEQTSRYQAIMSAVAAERPRR